MAKHMKILFTIGLTIFLSNTVFGTEQYPDKIIYKGKEYDLYSYPLECYFKKHPDKRPEGPRSSALWRRYVATFEIKDNQLYIKNIELMIHTFNKKEGHKTKYKSVLNEVFPNQELVKLDCITGLLHLSYTGGSFLLEINNGDLKTEKQFNDEEYEEFKEKQFQIFKKTEEYEKIKAEFLKEKEEEDDDDDYDEYIDYFLQNFVIEYTSKILVEDDEE